MGHDLSPIGEGGACPFSTAPLGAFEGLVSTPEERAALRRWIDQEKASLAVEDAALRQRADPASAERVERLRADRDHLNREIDRYNLMLRYPDGR